MRSATSGCDFGFHIAIVHHFDLSSFVHGVRLQWARA
jgi:hypothetical protein